MNLRDLTDVIDDIVTGGGGGGTTLSKRNMNTVTTTKKTVTTTDTIFEKIDHLYDSDRKLLLVQDNYKWNSWQPTSTSEIDLVSLIKAIDYNILLPSSVQKLFNQYSSCVNRLKQSIVAKSSSEIGNLDAILLYIYLVGSLLPIFGNTKKRFTYNQVNARAVEISNNHMTFEYLMIQYYIVVLSFNEFENQRAKGSEMTRDVYNQQKTRLSLAIDILDAMVSFITSVMVEFTSSVDKYKLIYYMSPTSISSADMKKDASKGGRQQQDEEECKQHLQYLDELRFVDQYFGGISGLKSRSFILHAKLYEFSFQYFIKESGLGGHRSSLLDECDAVIANKNSHDALEHLPQLAIMIQQYYQKASMEIDSHTRVSSIPLSSRNGEKRTSNFVTYYYCLYKSIEWSIIASYIQSTIDYVNYEIYNDITDGLQSLKRLDNLMTNVINVFYQTFIETATTTVVYDNDIISNFEAMKIKATAFQSLVTHQMNLHHRTSQGVELLPIESLEVSIKDSMLNLFENKFKHVVQSMESKMNSMVNESLAALHEIKNAHFHHDNQQNIEESTSIDSSSLLSRFDEDHLTDCKLKVAIARERLRWCSFIMQHESEKRNVIMIKNIGYIKETMQECQEIVDYNNSNEQTVSFRSNVPYNQ